jgi:hypothetical protein
MVLGSSARSVLTALAMGAVAGCAAGPMPGNLTVPGKAPERVTIKYESSLFGGSGTLSTVLPGGERYQGKYILTPYAPDHHMTSTLAGDRGGFMTCTFKLNEPGVGPDKGGSGRCVLPRSGGVIETQF